MFTPFSPHRQQQKQSDPQDRPSFHAHLPASPITASPDESNSARLSALLHQSLVAERLGPLAEPGQKEAFLPLLQRIAPDEAHMFTDRLQRLRYAETVGYVPVVGVCGLINSGKSTLVRSFLDESNKPRVLVGSLAEQGTHRFVLWLPQSWERDQATVQSFLRTAFDGKLVGLAKDPGEAAEQTNAPRSKQVPFELPLVAFDSRLDDHGLALLDCPDIQRGGHATDGAESTARHESLRRAARLCSAFILLCRYDFQNTTDLNDVVSSLDVVDSQLPLYFALTKVPMAREDCEDSIQRAFEEMNRRHRDLGLEDRFRRCLVSPYTADLQNLRYLDPAGQQTDLADMLGSLEPSVIQKSFMHSELRKVRPQFEGANACLERRQVGDQQKASEIRQSLLEFIKAHFYDDDSEGLKPIYSRELVHEMMKCIAGTAPVYAKPTMHAFLFITRSLEGIGKKLDGLTSILPKLPKIGLPGFMAKVLTNTKNKILKPSRKVDPRQFADHMRLESWILPQTDGAALEQLWKDVVERINEIGHIDGEELRNKLREAMVQVWASVPWWKKAGIAGAAPVLLAGALVVLCVGVVDMGGTAVIYSMSVSEIFAALGAGALANQGSGKLASSIVARHAAIPQHSRVFAMLQDRFGLPRADARQLRRMQINRPMRLAAIPAKDLGPLEPCQTCSVFKEPPFRLDRRALTRLERKLADIEKVADS